MRATLGLTIIIFCLIVSPANAQVASLFNIEASTVTFDNQGGCILELTLVNNYNETLRISGQSFLVNRDGVSLAEKYFSFPPAIPRGKSLTSVKFHKSRIAGGLCPQEFDVRMTTEYCFVIGNSTSITDLHCKKAFGFSVRKRSQ